ncbi:MAG: GNAT family N-acetyltransferase [Saprospiraceae bacterium]
MLETERLILLPLTYKQLLKYIKNDFSLDKELQLTPTPRTISADLLEALQLGILPNVADKRRNPLFYTLWTMILKSENCMVGDLCFKGKPNERGEIEIGYGTYDAFQGKGYMTEAVGAMIKWAATQPSVKYITAETEQENIASFKVLEKNKFSKHLEVNNIFVWKRAVKD